MSTDKYLDNFWTPKYFGHFWTTFLVIIGLRIGQGLRSVRILHHYLIPPVYLYVLEQLETPTICKMRKQFVKLLKSDNLQNA